MASPPNTGTSVRGWGLPTISAAEAKRRSAAATGSSTTGCAPTTSAPRPRILRSTSRRAIFDGNIDNPTGGTQRAFPPNIAGIRDRMPTPRITSFNLGVQHEILSGTIVHANYVGTLGKNLTRTVNINQLRAGTRLSPRPARPTSTRSGPTRATATSRSPRTRTSRAITACSCRRPAGCWPGSSSAATTRSRRRSTPPAGRRRIPTTLRATTGCRRFTARTTSTAISSGRCRSSATAAMR